MEGSHLLIIMVAAIVLAVLAERRQAQAPLLLAIVGMAASFIPGVPRIDIPPEVMLGFVVAPLLYSAALDFSFTHFIRRIGPILNLGVALVFVTASAVATVATWALPVLPLAMALALGAAVAPPDAVSAISIGRQLKLPESVMTLLKGESLINDAAALALFSGAVVLATGDHAMFDSNFAYFLYAAIGGAVIGLLAGALGHRIRRRIDSPSLVSALAVVMPFATYALAEEFHMSGVVAVVFAGFAMGVNSVKLPYDGRIREREVWSVIDTVLEAFIFTYMGLQLRFLADDALAAGQDLALLTGVAGLILLTVVGVRIAWVFVSAKLARTLRRVKPRAGHHPVRHLTWRENAVVSWAGMRGVVTLAAAAAMPVANSAGEPLAGRPAMLLVAFLVAIGSLVLYGLTLPGLIRGLKVDDRYDRAEQDAHRHHAATVMARAAEQALAQVRSEADTPQEAKVVDLVSIRFRHSADLPTELERNDHDRSHAMALKAVRAALQAQREALIAESRARRLDEETMRELLADIDLEQAALYARLDRVD